MPSIERITSEARGDSFRVLDAVEKVCKERGMIERMVGDDERGDGVWAYGVGKSDGDAEAVTFINPNNFDSKKQTIVPTDSILIASQQIIDEVKRVLQEDKPTR